MKPTIYIDGQAGTTGLQIYQRLGDREDITLLSIDPSKRKDAAERKSCSTPLTWCSCACRTLLLWKRSP